MLEPILQAFSDQVPASRVTSTPFVYFNFEAADFVSSGEFNDPAPESGALQSPSRGYVSDKESTFAIKSREK